MDSRRELTQRGRLLKKSRSGCHECRVRKVKCDELRPVCSNCRRRFVTIQSCDWSASVLNRGLRGRLVQAPLYQQANSTESNQWRVVELRLIYHYTAVLCDIMPNCGTGREIWKRVIPELSFESELVLNPMLALSALHLHSHLPNDRGMEIALRRYLDRSLINQRGVLSDPKNEFSEQIWLSTIILPFVYWLLTHQRQTNGAYELPLQVFKMMEGVGAIFMRNQSFIRQLGYNWIGSVPFLKTLPRDRFSVAAQIQLKDIEDDLTRLLEVLAEDDMNIYMEVKDYIIHHYEAYYSNADGKTLQLFLGFMPLRCQPRYRTLLEKHDPLAMALMARMIVLLQGVEHAWWINGEGNFEVVQQDIRGILQLLPQNLRWIMDWPLKVLDGSIVLCRD
ncbi:hypothetical protein B0I35DRAFT_181299 [Stachybotrys elegans]|uniref:Zn(2)-C6 fungal-type domain-containing protein n=1 Tax=Stachybotrys elegans TaxID=80388 RepID=A0A8K0SCN8_9HYPO|nr:hypothetical protein B0I35DRAFT_181299 [Stachybotrys elegans]